MSVAILCEKTTKEKSQCMKGCAMTEEEFSVGRKVCFVEGGGHQWRQIGHGLICFCIRVLDGSECD
jgi:hypothetical protein